LLGNSATSLIVSSLWIAILIGSWAIHLETTSLTGALFLFFSNICRLCRLALSRGFYTIWISFRWIFDCLFGSGIPAAQRTFTNLIRSSLQLWFLGFWHIFFDNCFDGQFVSWKSRHLRFIFFLNLWHRYWFINTYFRLNFGSGSYTHFILNSCFSCWLRSLTYLVIHVGFAFWRVIFTPSNWGHSG